MHKKTRSILLMWLLALSSSAITAGEAPPPATKEDVAAQHLMRGNAYFEEGRRNESRAHRKEAASNYTQATAEYRRAVAADPKNVGAYRLLARALHLQGQYHEAAEVYAQVVRLQPGDIDDRIQLADALYRIQDYAGATQQLKAAKDYTADVDVIARLDDYIERVSQARLATRKEGAP